MADENRPAAGDPYATPSQAGSQDDARYFGPFAPQPGRAPYEPTQPVPTGTWYAEPVRGTQFPAPPGVPAPVPQPPAPANQHHHRPRRGLALMLGAGLTALVVGGAAGFGGARLADWSVSAPAPPPVPASSAPPREPAQSRAPAPPAPRQLDIVAVAKAVLPSTVMIQVGSGSGTATGSGFVLDTAGHVLTNNHVVARAADGGLIRVVFSDGRRSSGSIVGRSPSYDIAVIKVGRTGLTPMKIGDSDATQVGQRVIAVGAPLALPGTVTEGIVSAKNRPVVVNASSAADAPTAYINGIQTDAPINPGNSGGPLIDAGARVIGVNSAILTLGQSREPSGNIGLGFAIPIKQALQIARLLIKDGKATYPVLGAGVTDDRLGVRLTSVEPSGPADRAGLRTDDVVTGIDGQSVDTPEELIVAVRTHRPSEQVKLGYRRGTGQASATVTLGGREG